MPFAALSQCVDALRCSLPRCRRSDALCCAKNALLLANAALLLSQWCALVLLSDSQTFCEMLSVARFGAGADRCVLSQGKARSGNHLSPSPAVASTSRLRNCKGTAPSISTVAQTSNGRANISCLCKHLRHVNRIARSRQRQCFVLSNRTSRPTNVIAVDWWADADTFPIEWRNTIIPQRRAYEQCDRWAVAL